jgi:hypothetical protein
MIFHMAPYSPPPAHVLAGIAAVAALVAAAYLLPKPQTQASRSAPSPWTVGLAAFALGAPWAAFSQVGWGSGAFPALPVLPVLLGGLAWAGLTFLVMRRWTSGAGWSEAHRYAVVTGGVLACIGGGFAVFALGGASRIDWIGKAVLDGIACFGLVVLRRRL